MKELLVPTLIIFIVQVLVHELIPEIRKSVMTTVSLLCKLLNLLIYMKELLVPTLIIFIVQVLVHELIPEIRKSVIGLKAAFMPLSNSLKATAHNKTSHPWLYF